MKEKMCPDRDLLSSHLLGKVRGEMIDSVDKHLTICQSCLEIARELDGEDEMTRAFRASKPHFEGDKREVARVIERGKRLRSEAETVEAEKATIATGSPPAAHRPNVDEEIDFLAPAEQPDEIGRLAEYRVFEVLGVGGMGVVFRAEDSKLKRQVALKVMKPAIAASRLAKDRFIREARATAAIEHDNIVDIYQVGEDRSVPFIAMQFLRGESLQKRLTRDNQLSEREALRIGSEVAAGLEAAHGCGLVHRDIKPDNIWMDARTGRAKILDFGLVCAAPGDVGLTQSGMILGTPRYMAPEQALGQDVDHRCDLFSLGSVLYQIITGQAPFKGKNLTSTLTAVAHDDPLPVEQACPRIDPEFSRLIMRLLIKNRNERPQSATDVVRAIAEIERKIADDAVLKGNQVAVAVTKTRGEPFVPSTRSKSRALAFASCATAAITLAVLLALLASAAFFRVEGKNGTLVVKVTGGTFTTSVQGRKVTIENLQTGRTFTVDLNSAEETTPLAPGSYQFLLESNSGLRTKAEQFTIVSGKNEVVEVWWEPKDHGVKDVGAHVAAKADKRSATDRQLQDLRRRFHGRVSLLSSGAVEFYYDFEDATQLEDWIIREQQSEWGVENGTVIAKKLASKNQSDTRLYHKARFDPNKRFAIEYRAQGAASLDAILLADVSDQNWRQGVSFCVASQPGGNDHAWIYYEPRTFISETRIAPIKPTDWYHISAVIQDQKASFKLGETLIAEEKPIPIRQTGKMACLRLHYTPGAFDSVRIVGFLDAD